MLGAIDAWAEQSGLAGELLAAERYAPTAADGPARLALDLGEVRTVLWATGFRPDYSWLHVPVLDRQGALKHTGGVLDAPGLYALGLPYLRRRKSSFIHGAEDDARELGAHLADFLDCASRRLRSAVRL